MKSYYFPSVIAILRSITLIDMDDGLAISTNLSRHFHAELHWKILSARTMLYTDAKHESRKKAIAREEVESTNRIINVHTFRWNPRMCRVCARTTRKSRDTSRAAFIWRVKTFGQPYHITLSTKSSGVPPTSRNNKFSHIFSPRRALSFLLWGKHSTISVRPCLITRR